jgi:hypothetical protein
MSLRIQHTISENVFGEIVLGRNRSFPRSVAMNLLPKSGLRGAEGLLAQVLADDRETPGFRRLAAANLYRINSPRSRQALLQAAGTVKDETALAGVVKALGRIGDQTALGQVLAIKERATGTLAAQAAFAASMISYRLGLEGNNLPSPRESVPLPAGPRLPLAFEAPPQAEIDLFMDGMAAEPCGVELARESLQTFQCPGGHWMIAVNRELSAGDAVQLLARRKMLLGVLAAKHSEDGHYAPSYFLFAAPNQAQRNVSLTITRVSGEPAWAGTAEITEPSQAKFSLGTAGRTGITPVAIEGVLSRDGKVRITAGVTPGRVLEKRSPQRLAPPPVG